MAARKATGGARNKLAVILSGNAARAASHLGALEALEAHGLAPAVLVGVSGGALAAALYAAHGDALPARDELYQFVAENSWQQLADFDFDVLDNAVNRPYEISGFMPGDRLLAALTATSLGTRGFGESEPELFIVAADLNTGREVVFCNQTQQDLGADAPYRVFAQASEDLGTVNIAAACRASCGVPGLFQPLSIEQLSLVDGSLRVRKALTVAAAQKGVKRILWLHAGLDENLAFSLVTDYSGQSLAAGLTQAMTLAAAEQFDPHTGAPELSGIAVRYLNLATSSIGPAELTKVQQSYESGKRSLAAVLDAEPCEGGGGWFTAPREDVAKALAAEVDELDGPRWQVTVGAGGQDVLAVCDLMPPVQQEFGYEFDEYLRASDLARIAPREPISSAAWGQGLAAAELGYAKLAWLTCQQSLVYCWRGLGCGLRTAWAALGLNRAWRGLTNAVGNTALSFGDALGHKPVPEDEPPASEPAQDA